MTTRSSFKLAVLAIIPLTVTVLMLLVPVSQAQARPCHTATSNITNRKNISCNNARRVVRIVVRESGVYPSCRGDIAMARGWVGRGIYPLYSNRVIAARFRKGNMSFVLSGGGVC